MPEYVPILKSKPAEIWAWCNSTPAVTSKSRVLFEVVPSTTKRGPIYDFISRISRNWPTGSVMTVDSRSVNQPSSGVWAIAESLRQRIIPVCPVVRLDDSPQILSEVNAACALHSEGACLRLGSEDRDPDPCVTKSQVDILLQVIGLNTTEIDLLIDFKVIGSERDGARCVPLAISMLQWAAKTGSWRRVTVASGAFPQRISDLSTGMATSVPRFDADFFSQVVSASGNIQPDYGDYGINYPIIGPVIPRSPNPNLRYTEGLVWQVDREAKLLPGNESFFTICERVVQSGYRAGANYSAGDEEIERCSQGIGGAGTATQWLSYGTSHHLATIADRLTNLGAP
ncbi:MAG: hypothetical protein CL902_09485 [Dehalococcoidia bacterium]|nr:hypothetical protein [Dehalococcoidia bacterium]